MTKSIVYYGSPRQARLDARETLPAKLDLKFDKLHLRDRVKGENVITRGYTQETVGCPIYPAAGLKEKFSYCHHRPFKSIQDWHVAGMIEDASLMVNFAHFKGHPSCSFGGSIKNITSGCMTGISRSAVYIPAN